MYIYTKEIFYPKCIHSYKVQVWKSLDNEFVIFTSMLPDCIYVLFHKQANKEVKFTTLFTVK
jgi:hypothetical protein